MTWLRETLDAIRGHVGQLLFGCSHPKKEPTGVDHVMIAPGEYVAIFYATCTVCGAVIVSAD